MQRISQARIILVYEYRVNDSFNIYLVNRNKSKAIPGIITELSPDIALSIAEQDSRVGNTER